MAGPSAARWSRRSNIPGIAALNSRVVFSILTAAAIGDGKIESLRWRRAVSAEQKVEQRAPARL
jgi:hypothetical protein